MEEPVDAIAALGRAIDRSKRKKNVAFPPSYVRQMSKSPMSATLMKSNESRLKLHLTYAMQATASPRTVPDRPTHYLAQMLNMPGDAGTRRMGAARAFLREQRLIEDGTLPDGKSGLALMSPEGSGKPWETPKGSRYIGIPIGLWSNAWICALSGRALAVLLALLELTQGSDTPGEDVMDRHRKNQYGLSDDTWTRGTKELERLGLVRTEKKRHGNDSYVYRTRTFYHVDIQALDTPPDWEKVAL